MRLEREDAFIERIELAAQGFKSHGADHVGPLAQTLGIGDSQAAQAGHARRTVDQAQPVLGAEGYRGKDFFFQGLFSRDDLPAITHLANAQQRNTDVRHVGQITHRTLRRHLRSNTPIEQVQQRFDHLPVNAGFALAVVENGGADDRAGLFIGQRRTDAAGVAEQGIARQTAELFAL